MAHGGVGSDPAHADGCRAAVDVALRALAADGDPVRAAVAGAVVLEDDPRFNAGTGSTVRLDGSVQMDASVMDDAGRFTAVAGIERVKNPVRVAHALRETPQLLLIGDGATQFARACGHADYDPATPLRRAATAALLARIARADPTLPPFWREGAWRAAWNYPVAPEAVLLALGPAPTGPARTPRASDTVGVVVRAADGRFAGALSTGGTAIVLRGRVGDVPLFGAGLYAGRCGAVAATGAGERITEALLAKTVHDWLCAGQGAAEAAKRGVGLFAARPEIDVGLIVVTHNELAMAASEPMACAGREADRAWE